MLGYANLMGIQLDASNVHTSETMRRDHEPLFTICKVAEGLWTNCRTEAGLVN
jgi:hypothetical protein